MLISIDPGIQCCGIAEWNEDDRSLRSAYFLKNQPGVYLTWFTMAYAIRVHLPRPSQEVLIAIETPQVYSRIKSKGDPNDLIRLAMLVGSVVTGYAHKTYLPSEWKKQEPKEITELRARKSLSDAELAVVDLPVARTLRHNVWDAVGLGLFHLNRR